jgi:hypothetical protein
MKDSDFDLLPPIYYLSLYEINKHFFYLMLIIKNKIENKICTLDR